MTNKINAYLLQYVCFFFSNMSYLIALVEKKLLVVGSFSVEEEKEKEKEGELLTVWVIFSRDSLK